MTASGKARVIPSVAIGANLLARVSANTISLQNTSTARLVGKEAVSPDSPNDYLPVSDKTIHLFMNRSLLLAVVCFVTTQTTAQTTATKIGTAVQRFIDSLTPAQKQLTTLPFSDSARTRWTNLPVGAVPRKGINIGALSVSQRQLFHRILSASFSSQGYLKITSVMHLDNLVNSLLDSMHDGRRMNDTVYQLFKGFRYSHRNYYIAVFGSPVRDKEWGYKIEGHHVSVNITCKNGRLSFTPFFIGAIPADVSLTEYAGWRVLGREQDLGLQLFISLSPAQRKKALSPQEPPEDIFTNSESGKNSLPYWGLRSQALTANQRKILDALLHEYCYNLPPDEAAIMLKKTADKTQPIYFGWMGSPDETEPHYFVLNGSSFLLEFADVGNHIHSIWREKDAEF